MITETAEERRPLGNPGVVLKDLPAEDSAPKPKREREPKQKAAPKRNPRDLWPIAVRATLLACAFMALIFVWYQVEQFLIADPRFALAGPTEASEETGLRMEGLKHATPAQLTKIFRSDFGRSIYLVDLVERRRDLLGLPWVKDAAISRIWPNHLQVRLIERKPFANVLLAIPNEGEATTRIALIDEEGVFLENVSSLQVQLPVLRGLSLGMPDAERRLRVARAQRMLRETGELAEGISEVDVSDAENLKITRPVGDRALTLWLGRENFRPRLESFYKVVDQIRKQYPKRTVFDLRTRDIISPGESAE